MGRYAPLIIFALVYTFNLYPVQITGHQEERENTGVRNNLSIKEDLSNDEKPVGTTYAKSIRTVNGVTFEYYMNEDSESLHVIGKLPADFDEDAVMADFRATLGIEPGATTGTQSPSNSDKEASTSKSVLESFTEYFVGNKFVSKVKGYYDSVARTEIEEQLQQTKDQKMAIEDDLNNVLTQQLILRKRQAELGAYIQETLQKAKEDRNPTVLELVITEDDRLALLEQRLRRMKDKLLKQKNEFEKFIRIHEPRDFMSSGGSTTINQPPEKEVHIFTKEKRGAIPDYTDNDKNE